jgi:hypothetical protein
MHVTSLQGSPTTRAEPDPGGPWRSVSIESFQFSGSLHHYSVLARGDIASLEHEATLRGIVRCRDGSSHPSFGADDDVATHPCYAFPVATGRNPVVSVYRERDCSPRHPSCGGVSLSVERCGRVGPFGAGARATFPLQRIGNAGSRQSCMSRFQREVARRSLFSTAGKRGSRPSCRRDTGHPLCLLWRRSRPPARTSPTGPPLEGRPMPSRLSKPITAPRFCRGANPLGTCIELGLRPVQEVANLPPTRRKATVR